MRVAVIGGGVSGLATAFALTRAGLTAEVFERDAVLGGLAARCTLEGFSVDKYYHFVCGGDRRLAALCRDLDLPITWAPTRTSFYYEGHRYPFGSARHLLSFNALSWSDRYRLSKMMLRCYLMRDGTPLDSVPAEEWLISELGEHAYRVIWYPLLSVKFGDRYRDISAAWVWHRIHRLLTSRKHPMARELLGYIHGGAGEVIGRLSERVREAGGVVSTGAPVRRLSPRSDGRVQVETDTGESEYEAVVCSIPGPEVCRLLDGVCSAQLRQVEYIGVVCLLMVLARPVSDSFWVNTNDSRIAFNGFIELSNLNPRVAGDRHLVYVPYYCAVSSPRFSMPDEAVLNEYLEALRLIEPKLSMADVIQWRVFRDTYAQPVTPVRFGERVPSFTGPWPNLFVLESSQLYPADRNLSGMIELADRVSDLVLASVGGGA